LAFAALLAMWVSLARAEELPCDWLRLDDGGSMSKVPVVHQPDNLCAPYALAQMIDAWRFSHGPQPPAGGQVFHTSGLELAVAFASHAKRPLYADGELTTLHRFIREHHPYACDSRVTNPGKSHAEKGDVFAQELMTYWHRYTRFLEDRARLKALLASDKKLSPLSLITYGSYEVGADLKCDLLPVAPLGTPALAALLRKSDPVDYLNGIFSALCEKDRMPLKVPDMHEELFPLGKSKEAAHRVIALLSIPNAQPVALNFCANVLQDPEFTGKKVKGFTPECRPHFALAIGQRRNPETGVCQVLIQNTMGTSCEQELPKQRRVISPRWDCEGGKYWIDRGALFMNTRFIEYFQ